MAKSKRAPASVGANVARAEGIEKLTGQARYIDDITFPGMIYGATVRSTIAHGRVVEIERDPTFDWSDFVIVGPRDIPEEGRNVVAMIVDDQPFLVEERVRHQAEPLLLLAHADRARLAAALKHLKVHYADEPAVLDFETASQVLKEIKIEKGDLDAGFAEADRIIEGTYRTGAQEQLYIECNGVIAMPEGGGITIYGSMQCPYYVSKAMQKLFGLPQEKIRVVQTTTGGGFGGKEEYP